VCNRGKSLIFSNLFPLSECYTDKATAPIYPKRAQLSPAHKNMMMATHSPEYGLPLLYSGQFQNH